MLQFSILASLLIIRLLHARLSRHDFAITKRTNEPFGTSITRKFYPTSRIWCAPGFANVDTLLSPRLGLRSSRRHRHSSAIFALYRAALRRESLGEEKNGPLNYIPIGSHANNPGSACRSWDFCALRDSIAALASTDDLEHRPRFNKRIILYLTLIPRNIEIKKLKRNSIKPHLALLWESRTNLLPREGNV